MTMIRAVLFDLWGTLIVDDPASGAARERLRIEATRAVLADAGFDYAADDIRAGFMAAGVELGGLHEQERDLSARGRTITYLRQVDADLPDRLDDAAWRRLDEAILTPALTHGPEVMPGAADALAAVHGLGLAIGMISNTGITPGYVLREVLAGFGLLRYLDLTVFSDEVEMSKPAPAIFEHALGEMGLEAGEAAFVGDQPRLDVFGSRRAGLWCVQIGDLEGEDAQPHARIAALHELVPALRALGLVG
jgi:putative hydrolase of the HAD superfamily